MAKLPDSFAEYRKNSLAHGPLTRQKSTGIGSNVGAAVPSLVFSVSELPRRFQMAPISDLELESINSGGANFIFHS